MWVRLDPAATLFTLLFATTTANADEAPSWLPSFAFDTGRVSAPPPEPDTYRFSIHGEHQLRYQVQRSFPLVASASAVAQQPNLLEQSLGQNQFLSHWLRITPRLQLKETFELVGQLDLTGLIAGDKARDSSADATPRNELNGFSNLQPRWLYAQYRLPFGMFRIGQQPNHWGMGILANDGDHPTLFGDYRYGQISERLLFSTKPGGNDSDFVLAFAADLVFRDNYARLTRGQQAVQGVLAAYYEHGLNKLGLFSTFRHQENDRFAEELDSVSIDLHGRIATEVPGDPDAWFVGEAEAAYVFGSTSALRDATQAREGSKTQIRSYGGAASLSYVHRGWVPPGKPVFDQKAHGDLVAGVELGYASGDADPYDGTQRRFVFDPNHRIGLLLFDEILRFQTARSATAAADPLLGNGSRPPPGNDLFPSNGGVFGAQYINPTVIVRPRRWLDLKAGAVVAQSTSDVVDPYRVATAGSYVNYRGGEARKRDLGIELDGGIEMRFPLPHEVVGVTGAQAGVLFPGGALEDANGNRLNTQWITVFRLGLLF